MKVAIVHAEYSRQASTVRDSIESLLLYGENEYVKVPLREGEFDIALDGFAVVILHYSCIAFPYKYYQPISARSALKIANFKGIKLALVQDEQRSAIERLRFLNTLGIDHLFSVAEPDLYELLYPSKVRDFSISTVLTGYISEQHVQVAKKRIPLSQRSVDVCYRGRRLPSWMGEVSSLKGEIPNILMKMQGINAYKTDLSSNENSRLYDAEWFDFLQTSRISIGTPSGSNYLDLHGKFQESWIKQNPILQSDLPDPVPANYQVISPRYFDYVSAGNLVVLTPGSYSNVPIAGTFFELADDLTGLMEILEFSGTGTAQMMVDKSQNLIMSNPKLHYRFFVEHIEKVIERFLPKASQQKHYDDGKRQNLELPQHKVNLFLELVAKLYSHRRFLALIKRPLPSKILAYRRRLIIVKNTLKNLSYKDFVILIRDVPGARGWHYFSLRAFWEIANIFRLSGLLNECNYETEVNKKFLSINVTKFIKIQDEETSSVISENEYPRNWVLSLEEFGALNAPIILRTLPTIFNRNPEYFWRWARDLEVILQINSMLDK